MLAYIFHFLIFFFFLEYDSDPDLESLWCTDSPGKSVVKQVSSGRPAVEDNNESFSCSGFKTGETVSDSPSVRDSPSKFFSPSIRINLPSYAAFSSTPNLSSPSWQKIVSGNGEQSFSFSFDLDNSSTKSDVDMGCSSLHNQSVEYGKNDGQSRTLQSGASHIVLHMSPSVDSGIDVSLRSNHTTITEHSMLTNGSLTAPSSTVPPTLPSIIPSSSRTYDESTTPNRKRRCELLPLDSITKSMPSRSALMPIANTVPLVANSSTCANQNLDVPTASTHGKRKSSHDMGNENKTRVVSPK